MSYTSFVPPFTSSAGSEDEKKMPLPLPDALHSIGVRARKLGHIELFCDYDGVLSPIDPHPADAHLLPGVRARLMELKNRKDFHVNIVSGRALVDIRLRVEIPGITYSGNHGLEIDGPDMEHLYPIPLKTRESLRTVATELEREFAEEAGVIIENKTLVIALHYRLASRDRVPTILARFAEIVSKHNAGEELRMAAGKELVEARPNVPWDKGEAVLWLLEQRHGKDWEQKVLPVYLGDDETDEDAFRALRNHGVTVRVEQGMMSPTIAHYALADARKVEAFLDRLGHTLDEKK